MEERHGGETTRFCCQVDSAEINVRLFTGGGAGTHCTSCGSTPAVCAVSAACEMMEHPRDACPPTGTDGSELLPGNRLAICARSVCRVSETGSHTTLLRRCSSDMHDQNLQIPEIRDTQVRTPQAEGAQ